MSELARQLRERGLAKDSLDAVNQAKSATSSDPAVLAQRKQDAVLERLDLLERKHESMQRRLEDLQSQLEQSNRKLAEANSQVSSFNAKLRNLEIASTANIVPIPPPQWQPQEWQQSVPQARNEMPQEKTPVSAPIDRNGVAPADVSVEKFFYFGNKR